MDGKSAALTNLQILTTHCCWSFLKLYFFWSDFALQQMALTSLLCGADLISCDISIWIRFSFSGSGILNPHSCTWLKRSRSIRYQVPLWYEWFQYLTLGCQTSDSASSSKFYHLALLVELVLVSHSSNFHHWPLLALLMALVFH